MESKITIFESGIEDGILSRNKKFYCEDLSQEKINDIFLETRKKLGEKYGFNGMKMFQSIQKNELNGLEYPDGKYHVVTEKDFNREDLWYLEIPADILIINENIKNIVIGHQMADCPILIIEDRKLGVTAISHCGASYINRSLPSQTVQALVTEYNSNPKDLYAYIGSCAKKESYQYDRYPKWATNKTVWEGYIIKNDELYSIDMPGAMEKQLKGEGVENITISKEDTITNKFHYSHSAYVNGNIDKKGQNFVGFFYK